MASSLEVGSKHMGFAGPGGRKRKTISLPSDDEDSASDSSDERPLAKQQRLAFNHHSSKFEEIPTEILNQIVTNLPDDNDLLALVRTCAAFADTLTSEKSAIWRERFLLKWDHPFVAENEQFEYAYRERACTLRLFVPFNVEEDERLLRQLEHLTYMVLETYNQPNKHLPQPLTSLNLQAFESPQDSPWMVTFLSCSSFPKTLKKGRQKYGQPHPVFDALQLVLSHLLLSPASPMALAVKSTRDDYNLALVYNWDRPFATLYRQLPKKKKTATPRRTKLPNLKPRTPKATEPDFELDTHALLHIRTFWHRHLITGSPGANNHGQMNSLDEHTYAGMARDLCDAGITARKWDHMLEEGLPAIAEEWYGHYSSVHPWPKKRQNLEEVQSDAEDWSSAHPMKLDISISEENRPKNWPPVFQDIPALRDTLPEGLDSCVTFRGIAPFVDLREMQLQKSSEKSATKGVPSFPKYHPYMALRVRGVIRPIESQPRPDQITHSNATIPGWSRLVMVMYKPTSEYLLDVLEYKEGNYGGTFATTLTTQMLQAGQIQPGQALDHEVIERERKEHIKKKLLADPMWQTPASIDKEVIAAMEEKFSASEHLQWEDMEYAYAYEGVLLPGGKIMMGRYWGCGLNGEGSPGMEVDEDGQTLEDESPDDGGSGGGSGGMAVSDGGNGGNSGSQGASQTGAKAKGTGRPKAKTPVKRHLKLERGPFVFWC
nr:hypothetical protein LTR18_005165 [Exophiala xenobiotica]